MKLRIALAVLLSVFTLSCGKKTPSLNLLVWEGYADPSFVKAFEEQNHCKVSASYMGSSDELVAKLRGGSAGNYDVISPSSDVATMISQAELGCAPGPLKASELSATVCEIARHAAGQSQRKRLRRTFHVGAEPADL